MVKATAPFPSGGFEPNQKRRRNGRDNTPKERKSKRSPRMTYEQWLFRAMPDMVDSLCRKVYENKSQYSGYGTREEFCSVYSELVIDRRWVKGPVERADLLVRILGLAENRGRIEVVGSRRKVNIFLSEAERKEQKRQAKVREAKAEEKWQSRRQRKAA